MSIRVSLLLLQLLLWAPSTLAISCYSCSTFDVEPAITTVNEEQLRHYIGDEQTYDAMAGPLGTDCEPDSVAECAPFFKLCISSHISLSTEKDGLSSPLGHLNIHMCGSKWLERDNKFCELAENGLVAAEVFSLCYMQACESSDKCNIPESLVEGESEDSNQATSEDGTKVYENVTNVDDNNEIPNFDGTESNKESDLATDADTNSGDAETEDESEVGDLSDAEGVDIGESDENDLVIIQSNDTIVYNDVAESEESVDSDDVGDSGDVGDSNNVTESVGKVESDDTDKSEHKIKETEGAEDDHVAVNKSGDTNDTDSRIESAGDNGNSDNKTPLSTQTSLYLAMTDSPRNGDNRGDKKGDPQEVDEDGSNADSLAAGNIFILMAAFTAFVMLRI